MLEQDSVLVPFVSLKVQLFFWPLGMWDFSSVLSDPAQALPAVEAQS